MAKGDLKLVRIPATLQTQVKVKGGDKAFLGLLELVEQGLLIGEVNKQYVPMIDMGNQVLTSDGSYLEALDQAVEGIPYNLVTTSNASIYWGIMGFPPKIGDRFLHCDSISMEMRNANPNEEVLEITLVVLNQDTTITLTDLGTGTLFDSISGEDEKIDFDKQVMAVLDTASPKLINMINAYFKFDYDVAAGNDVAHGIPHAQIWYE